MILAKLLASHFRNIKSATQHFPRWATKRLTSITLSTGFHPEMLFWALKFDLPYFRFWHSEMFASCLILLTMFSWLHTALLMTFLLVFFTQERSHPFVSFSSLPGTHIYERFCQARLIPALIGLPFRVLISIPLLHKHLRCFKSSCKAWLCNKEHNG